MKKILALFLLCVYIFSVPFLDVSATDSQRASVTNGSHSLDGQRPVLGNEQLITNAKSVLLYEVNTDTLMYAYSADEKLPPASFAKILTALIAITEGDLAATIIVRDDVLQTVASDAVRTKFTAGETLTLEDLLYCMMVGSGNDAAALIADYIAGSQSLFVEKMNEYAGNFGCVNTVFTNVHGLHDDAQYTTARDVGRIMAEASKNDILCQIMGAKYYTVPSNAYAEERNLVSENYLINNDKNKLYFDNRIICSRTGVANDRTRCIASVSEDNGMRLISVVMGAESVYEKNGVTVKVIGGYHETSDILDMAFDAYTPYQLIYQGQVLCQRDILGGDCAVSLGTNEAAATVLPNGVTMANITVEYVHNNNGSQQPISEGEILSVARYMYGNVCVAEVDLVAMNTVGDGSVSMVRKTNIDQDGGLSTLMTLLLVIIGALVLYMLFMLYRKKLYKKHGKKQK